MTTTTTQVENDHAAAVRAMRSQTTERYAALCPQCGRERRITEPNAFGGRDKLRMTLSCGHIISKVISA